METLEFGCMALTGIDSVVDGGSRVGHSASVDGSGVARLSTPALGESVGGEVERGRRDSSDDDGESSEEGSVHDDVVQVGMGLEGY